MNIKNTFGFFTFLGYESRTSEKCGEVLKMEIDAKSTILRITNKT